MASHLRQENFSRTCWITFHCDGTNSSVSVTSSPSFRSAPPQQGQIDGAECTTRSRGRCSGSGRRARAAACPRSRSPHAARAASEQRAADAEARATGLEAEVRNSAAEIEDLKLTIAKMRRDKFGASSERGAKLLDQLELHAATPVRRGVPARARSFLIEALCFDHGT
jgi:hypothetical protein